MLIRKATKPVVEPLKPRAFWTPVEAIDITPALSGHKWKGSIQLGVSRRVKRVTRYAIAFDDLWDLKEMVEQICLDVGGRLYLKRAACINRGRLALEVVAAGHLTASPVTPPPDFDRGFYLGLETCSGECYHNYFVNLEDLIGLLHRCITDAQGIKRWTAAGEVPAVFHDRSDRRTLQ